VSCVSDLEARIDRWITFKEETWRAKRWAEPGVPVSSCSMAVIGVWCPLLVILCAQPYAHHDGQYMILVFILAEFGFYVLIRQIVNAKEWLSACRPPPTVIHPSPDLKLSRRERAERPPASSTKGLEDVRSEFSARTTNLYLTRTGMERRSSHARRVPRIRYLEVSR